MEKGWTEGYMTEVEMDKAIMANAGVKSVSMNQHDTAYQSFGEFILHALEASCQKAVVFSKN